MRLYNYFRRNTSYTMTRAFIYAHDTIIFTQCTRIESQNTNRTLKHTDTEPPRKISHHISHIHACTIYTRKQCDDKKKVKKKKKKKNIEFTFFVVAFSLLISNILCVFFLTLFFVLFSFVSLFDFFFAMYLFSFFFFCFWSGGLFPRSIIQIVSGAFSLNYPICLTDSVVARRSVYLSSPLPLFLFRLKTFFLFYFYACTVARLLFNNFIGISLSSEKRKRKKDFIIMLSFYNRKWYRHFLW